MTAVGDFPPTSRSTRNRPAEPGASCGSRPRRLLLLAFLCSEDRRRIPWRTVISGVVLQIVFALILIGIPATNRAMFWLNDAANALHYATLTGTQFVFGYLGGGAPAFAETHPGASFILAFQALPLVLTISALASLLFHWGILQRITAAFAWLLRRSWASAARSRSAPPSTSSSAWSRRRCWSAPTSPACSVVSCSP